MKGCQLNRYPAYNKLVNTKVQLQNYNEMIYGKVNKRALNPDGQTTGSYDKDSMLTSIIYEVEFEDGHVKEYSANTITDNMLTRVYYDGFTLTIMEGIIDSQKDAATAVTKEEIYIVPKRGQKNILKTKLGWQLLVQWLDQSESWINFKYLKEFHSIEVSKFDKARGIADEPAFAWWVPYTMQKRYVIVSAIKSRIRKPTHNYGIEIPTSIEHGHRIDKENGNNF